MSTKEPWAQPLYKEVTTRKRSPFGAGVLGGCGCSTIFLVFVAVLALYAITLDASLSPEERAIWRQDRQARAQKAAEERRKKERQSQREAEEIEATQREREAEKAAKQEERQEHARKSIEEFAKAIKDIQTKAGVAVVTNIKVRTVGSDSLEAIMTVDNVWHSLPYQIRLQHAQTFWEIWAGIAYPDNLDNARVSITDAKGNQVGGSRWIAGSMIWVSEK